MSNCLLELFDIHAAYLRKEILCGLSLTVQKGETVALIGENGSGKSTALKIVAGILSPSKGIVSYRGRNIEGLDATARQQLGIGYLMQGGRIFPNLNVQENFNLAAKTHDTNRKRVSLGDWFPVLRERRHDRAGLLSGGQRQMLAIELVLAQQPELLLLDEPTGALSDEIATQMLDAVAIYIREHAAASLLVEHALPASSYATRRLRLINGTLEDLQQD